MKKLLRFLVSRVFWFSLLIILQIAVTVILLPLALLAVGIVIWIRRKRR